MRKSNLEEALHIHCLFFSSVFFSFHFCAPSVSRTTADWHMHQNTDTNHHRAVGVAAAEHFARVHYGARLDLQARRQDYQMMIVTAVLPLDAGIIRIIY